MDLREAMTSGLFVEFLDSLGNSAGTAVYFDWSGQPVPTVGERFTCTVGHGPGIRKRVLAGYVKHRSFDVQTGDDGSPCLWVRLVVDLEGVRARAQNRWRASRHCVSYN